MSEHMVRKQIYLHRRQNLALRRLARQRGVSEAEVIRQALERESVLAISGVRGSKQALQNIIAYARSLRNRHELFRGEAYQFRREELYAEREQRQTGPKTN